MFLVKFTILFWVISAIGFRLFEAYLRENPLKAILWRTNKTCTSRCIISLINLTRYVLLIASLIWFMFFR